jgi:hypothetical protein
VHTPFVVSQIGLVPVHIDELVAEQPAHWFEGEHAGVAGVLAQSASVAHCSQWPSFPPLPTQTPERHSALPASPGVHSAPSASPQRLSDVPHTPDAHARAAMAEVHIPPGTICPFPTCIAQVPAPPSAPVLRLSHHCPDPHALSIVHVSPQAPVIALHCVPR